MKKKYLATPYIIWAIIFTVVPMFLVLYYGLTITTDKGIIFSLKNINKFMQPIYLKVMWRSILLALYSTVLCLLIAYPLAYILSKSKAKTNITIFLFVLPMWMNFLLRTYAWLSLLENNGIINSFLSFVNLPKINILYTDTATLLGMVYNFLPFMVLPIYTALKKIDSSIIEAARDLGSDRIHVFYKVIIPLSLPGVVSGITMVFMPAVTTFVIPKLLGGSKKYMIGNIIQEQFLRVGDWHFGSSLSLALMILILLSMKIINRYENQQEGVGLW